MNSYVLALVSFIVGVVIGSCFMMLYFILKLQKEENEKVPVEERDIDLNEKGVGYY